MIWPDGSCIYEAFKKQRGAYGSVGNAALCLAVTAFLATFKNFTNTWGKFSLKLGYTLSTWTNQSNVFFKYNQQDATLYDILYYCQCSTCFRRFLSPSSGAQKLYTQHLVYVKLACCYR